MRFEKCAQMSVKFFFEGVRVCRAGSFSFLLFSVGSAVCGERFLEREIKRE